MKTGTTPRALLVLLTIMIGGVALGFGTSRTAHAASPWYPPPEPETAAAGSPSRSSRLSRQDARPSKPAEQARSTTPTGERVMLTATLESGIVADRTRERLTTGVSPLLRIGLHVRPEVELGISAGAAGVFIAGDQNVRGVRPSNLGLGGRWLGTRAFESGRRRSVLLGFEFALPTSFSVDERGVAAYELAMAGRGAWNPWMWKPSTLAVVVPFGWSLAWTPRFKTGFEGAAAGLFAASQRRTGPKFAGQLSAFARVQIGRLGLEVAARGVYDGDAPDPTRFSVSPAADIGLCRRGRPVCTFHVFGRVNVNIDAPYGYGSDAMRILGGQVGLGWRLSE